MGYVLSDYIRNILQVSKTSRLDLRNNLYLVKITKYVATYIGGPCRNIHTYVLLTSVYSMLLQSDEVVSCSTDIGNLKCYLLR